MACWQTVVLLQKTFSPAVFMSFPKIPCVVVVTVSLIVWQLSKTLSPQRDWQELDAPHPAFFMILWCWTSSVSAGPLQPWWSLEGCRCSWFWQFCPSFWSTSSSYPAATMPPWKKNLLQSTSSFSPPGGQDLPSLDKSSASTPVSSTWWSPHGMCGLRCTRTVPKSYTWQCGT